MSSDHTEQQTSEQQRQSQRLSQKTPLPPTQIPGYELTELIGTGAYGEVWIGIDQNTGRRVAIKFYLHRGGLDWSLLSREVEKLVFLSADRYVVQLLDVGWESNPPYYVMEYVENGSLEDLLTEHSTLPVAQAVELFRETAVGLVHAHAKGVLHCDLKPANILLDQDNKPRLADFGQSRLSSEQAPSLGTLFYMAPEQAELTAMPDAQWDVYALGAMLYAMLTGRPPYRSEETMRRIDEAPNLTQRLRRYREVIRERPRPSDHLKLRGVDRALAEIIDRSIAPNPAERFGNVQEVLDAIDSRSRARAARPMVVMGIAGPILLLLVMALFAWRGYHRAMRDSDFAVSEKVKESNAFAARFAAATVASEVRRYRDAVEAVASDKDFQQLVEATVSELNAPPHRMLDRFLELSEPASDDPAAFDRFMSNARRVTLQQRMHDLLQDAELPPAASWFVCGPRGTQLAAAFDRPTAPTLGNNFAYRTYFHGGPADLDPHETPKGHVTDTHLSAPLRSTATQTLKVAVSTPLYRQAPGGEQRFLGVLAVTVEVGAFLREFRDTDTRFAVLVDGRAGDYEGAILRHPLFARVFNEQGELPDRFSQYRVDLDGLDSPVPRYQDPVAADQAGAAYRRVWVAAPATVNLERSRLRRDGTRERVPTGLVVLVQEDLAAAVGPLERLGGSLLREGLLALGGVICVVTLLWFVVLRVLGEPRHVARRTTPAQSVPTPVAARTTLAATRPKRPTP